MPTPQAGIFREGSRHHHFLEYAVLAGVADDAIVRTVAASCATRNAASLVVAFGAGLWQRLASDHSPAGLRPFEAIDGVDGFRAPATQRDLLFWIHGDHVDDNLDRALDIDRAVRGVARIALDQQGFTYHDSRDLTGFVDGSANPKGDAAREAALVAGDGPGAGGAFVLTQRWVHDLDSFLAQPVSEQERVIGRTKPDSIELAGDAMPPDSHVSRTDVSVDGVAQKIYRRSAPYGTVGEHGLYFLAFACDPARFDILLRRMFGTIGDGLRDRIVEFSEPVTGSYWFAPSETALRSLARGQ